MYKLSGVNPNDTVRSFRDGIQKNRERDTKKKKKSENNNGKIHN